MTHVRFIWRGIGEFILIEPETLFNFADEPYFKARYYRDGKLVNHFGHFPFNRAESIEVLPEQLEIAA